MTWNILHGFHSTTRPFALEAERLKTAQRVVSEHRPDVLILTEACYGGGNPSNHRVDYGQLFNYRHAYWAQWGEHEWGNCLLSSDPMCCSTVRLSSRTAIRGQILIGDITLHVDVVHLDPFIPEARRIQSIRPLLLSRCNPYVIAGDFNALSPDDHYVRANLVNGYARSLGKTQARKTVDNLMKRETIAHLLEQGLVDTHTNDSVRSYTFPTELARWSKVSAIRIDYIFCSPDLRSTCSRILKNNFTEQASDHYPVLAVLDFS